MSCFIGQPMVHAARPLLESAQGISPMERRLVRLRAQQPQKSTGRQLFYKELVAVVKDQQSQHPGRAKVSPQHMMAQHASLYKRLGEGVKRQYEHKAASEAALTTSQVHDDMLHVSASLILRRHRLEQEAMEQGLHFRMSSCRFSTHELRALDVLWHDQRFADRNLAALRRLAARAPSNLVHTMLNCCSLTLASVTGLQMFLRAIGTSGFVDTGVCLYRLPLYSSYREAERFTCSCTHRKTQCLLGSLASWMMIASYLIALVWHRTCW